MTTSISPFHKQKGAATSPIFHAVYRAPVVTQAITRFEEMVSEMAILQQLSSWAASNPMIFGDLPSHHAPYDAMMIGSHKFRAPHRMFLVKIQRTLT